jgi:lipopolysaccharide/colanic/teichoic acid biosynthesis glycosyltransferase
MNIPWYSTVTKRIFDFLGALLLLLILWPLLLAAALAIKLDSPGPVLFRQTRLGQLGRTFSIFKFRTMQDGSSLLGTGLETHRDDFRITRIGQVLRRTRVDELPQLLNVLRGEMSLVGPRPLLPEFLPYYAAWDLWRLEALPGMTGWQQVNGGARHSWAERVSLDVWYVDHRELLLDLWILILTVKVVLKREGVYAEDGSQRSGIPDGYPDPHAQGR